MKHTKQSASSKGKANHKASAKKPVPAKAKAAAKKTAPAKKVAPKKTVAAKPSPKKTTAKKPLPVKKTVAKKAVPKKPEASKKASPAKKAVAKKTVTPQKPSPKKAVPAKKVVPAKKAVVKTPTAVLSSKASLAASKTSAAAKKSTPAKTAPSSVNSATKSSSQKNDKTAAKSAAGKPNPTPTGATAPVAEVTKKSPRAAKAIAMMPPPPGLSVASTTAKSSYGPILVPSLPAVVPVVPVKNPKLANNWKNKSPDSVTDEEVIAMSDDDYMNAFQLAFFRHKLVQLKTDILVNAGETTEHLREDTVIVPDPADRATIEEEHALELRTRDRERKLLKKIEQSISRIDSGDYGYCDETGESIGVGRLIARPTATLSLEAQQRRELKQKMFGD